LFNILCFKFWSKTTQPEFGFLLTFEEIKGDTGILIKKFIVALMTSHFGLGAGVKFNSMATAGKYQLYKISWFLTSFPYQVKVFMYFFRGDIAIFLGYKLKFFAKFHALKTCSKIQLKHNTFRPLHPCHYTIINRRINNQTKTKLKKM
jgi:hypothetical protein